MRWRLPWFAEPNFDPETLAELAKVPFFADLPPRSLRRLASRCWPRDFEAGSRVLQEGDTGLGIFLILSGRVEVFKSVIGVQRRSIATLGAGEILGEMALVDDMPRSASAEAIEKTECLLLTRESYRGLIRRDPEIAWCMVPMLVERFRDLQELYVEARPEEEPGGGAAAEGEPSPFEASPSEDLEPGLRDPSEPPGSGDLLHLPAVFLGCGFDGIQESVGVISSFFSALSREVRLSRSAGLAESRNMPAGLLIAGRAALEEGSAVPERLAKSFLSRLRSARQKGH